MATEWQRTRFLPGPDLVVFELATRVPPESVVRVVVDEHVPSPAGPEHPPRPQGYALHVEPAFFVKGVQCETACDPDGANSISLTTVVIARRL